MEDEESLELWLKSNWNPLFEDELEGWYTDSELWPKDRSLEMLKKWCSFELHTVVVDTGAKPIREDEF